MLGKFELEIVLEKSLAWKSDIHKLESYFPQNVSLIFPWNLTSQFSTNPIFQTINFIFHAIRFTFRRFLFRYFISLFTNSIPSSKHFVIRCSSADLIFHAIGIFCKSFCMTRCQQIFPIFHTFRFNIQAFRFQPSIYKGGKVRSI